MTRNGHARLCQNISKKREYFTQIVFVLKCVSLWIFFFTSPTVFSALLDLVLCLFKLLKLEKVRKNKYNNQRKMMIFAHTQRKESLSLFEPKGNK